MGTPEMDAASAIQAAGEYGFSGIDLRVSEYKGELLSHSGNNTISHIRNILNSENIKLVSLLCYNDVGSEIDESWKSMEESLLRHLELGMNIGATSIRIFPGNPHGKMTFSDHLKYTADVLSSVINQINPTINILLQNHNNSYNALETVALIQEVNDYRLGIVFSPDHSYISSENMPEVYSAVKPYIRQLYVSDILKPEELKHSPVYKPVLPGRGNVSIRDAFMNTCNENFDGFITFKWEKIWHDYLEEPEVALPFFLNFWRTL
jgi:sugar phosphate isomerase/epimerase